MYDNIHNYVQRIYFYSDKFILVKLIMIANTTINLHVHVHVVAYKVSD